MKQSEGTIPFTSSYTAGADFTFPGGFPLARYGLLRCETVRDGPKIRAYLRWRSEAHWKANEPFVRKLLGLGDPDTNGPVVEDVAPRDPPWKRHPITAGKALIAVAALFGALSAVRDYFAELFFFPDIAVSVADSSPVSFHTGATLSIPLLVRNQALLGRAQARLVKAELVPASGHGARIGLHSTKIEIPQLAVGQAEELSLAGTAPVVTRGSKPMDYTLQVLVAEKVGLLVPSKVVTYATRTFSFWSDHTWESGVTALSPVAGRIDIGLYPGRAYPAGIRGQMIVRTATEPYDIDLQSGGKPLRRFIVAEDGPEYTTKLEFQTDPLQSFQRCPITINVGCKHSMTQQQWALAESTLRVEFQ